MTSGTLRHTIRNRVTISGHGLHTGASCDLALVPAAPGRGLVFIRRDLPGHPEIPATLAHVAATTRRTRLEVGSASVETVEHLLAAVWSRGLDDLEIHLDGPEPPIGDGSAGHFVNVLETAGVASHPGPARSLNPVGPLTVTSGDAEYTVTPAPRATLAVTIEWDHPLIGRQAGEFALEWEVLRREVLPARTFALAGDVAALRESGLIQGGTLDRALVVADREILGGPLRWPDEFVRHKALDLIGDLALLGRRYCCHISAWRPGHQGNILLARALNDHTGD